jgi:hypothetical protein
MRVFGACLCALVVDRADEGGPTQSVGAPKPAPLD